MASCEEDFLALCQDQSCQEEGKEITDLGGPSNESVTPKSISFDMWNGCTPSNFSSKLGQNKLFKPVCVYVLEKVVEYLSTINVQYFICGGTALSVYRENGKMIRHDGDVDIAILECEFSSVLQNLHSFPAMQDGFIQVSNKCPVNETSWFDEHEREISYNGNGGKRLKFCASRKLWDRFAIRKDLLFDPSLAHLDVFTFSRHPDDHSCFCYNWNIPARYDYRRKRFPKTCILPLKTYNFEGICVKGPNCLKTFLEVEYGYLGRDAMFDFSSQLYVKIPQSVSEKLPKKIRKVLTSDN